MPRSSAHLSAPRWAVLERRRAGSSGPCRVRPRATRQFTKLLDIGGPHLLDRQASAFWRSVARGSPRPARCRKFVRASGRGGDRDASLLMACRCRDRLSSGRRRVVIGRSRSAPSARRTGGGFGPPVLGELQTVAGISLAEGAHADVAAAILAPVQGWQNTSSGSMGAE